MNEMGRGKIFLAVFLAAMMAFCCLVPAIASDDSEAADSSASVVMRTGDGFSYNVTTNLSSTITATGTAISGTNHFLTYNASTKILSGTPTAAGSYTCVLTATWTGDGLSQTATQTITFTVYDRVTVTSASGSATAISGNAAGTVVKTFVSGTDYTGPSGTTVSCSVTKSGAASSVFVWDSASSSLKVGSAALTSSDVGTYTATWTVTFNPSGYKAADVKTYALTINVSEDLAITSVSDIYTYVGEGAKTYTGTTNMDGTAGASITKTAEVPNISSFVTSNTNGAVTMDFTGYNVTSASFVDVKTFTVSASGTLNGTALTTVTKTVNVHIYSNLAFTSTPTVGSTVTISSSSANPVDVMVSATISGASRIVVAWGDGTVSTVDPLADSNITYSARHVYKAPESYQITITAENSIGDTRTTVMYDANAGWAGTVDDVKNGANSLFDSHGYLWLALIVLGTAGAVAFLVWIRDLRLLAVAAVLILCGIVCYALGFKPF